jgi:hypothetical protein
MLRWMWIATALAAGAAAGCERKQEVGPSCKVITEHVYEITRKAYPGHGEMQMGNPKADIARCEARKLTLAQRRCMVEAKSVEALASCLPRDKPGEQKPEPPGTSPAAAGGVAPSAAPGAAPAPAPAPSAPPAPAPTPAPAPAP